MATPLYAIFQTGTVAVGFMNLVSVGLLFLWFVQTLLELQHAFIAVVVSSLIVFVLMVVNGCLIYGAQVSTQWSMF